MKIKPSFHPGLFSLVIFLFACTVRADDALDHWQLRDTNGITRVRYVIDRFIAVGTNGLLMTSLDGTNWIKRSSGTTAHLQVVAAKPAIFLDPRLYLAAGQSGVVASSDGTNWTQIQTTITGQYVNDLIWAGNSFIAATAASSKTDPVLFRSSNGTNWTGAAVPYGPTIGFMGASAVFARGSILLAAAGPCCAFDIFNSSDGGATWQKAGFSDQMVGGIAYGNGRYMMVGYESWPITSTNTFGTNWSFMVDSNNIATPAPGWRPMVGSDIAFGNGTFVVAPGMMKNGMLTTTNDVSWKRRAALKGLSIESVAYGNGTFIAAGPDGIYQSAPVKTPGLSVLQLAGTNAINIQASGAPGIPYRLQSSTNLQDWSDRWTFTNTWITTNFTDTADPTQPKSFYRVVSP